MSHPTPRVAIVFKDFACWTGRSHVGLCVAALTNARVLAQYGIKTAVFPVRNNIDLVNSIHEYADEHSHPLTHVIISAPWLSTPDLTSLIKGFPRIQFVIESHSNIGFLQADPLAIHRLRETLALAKKYSNIHVAGNSSRFVDWMNLVYDGHVILLPNLYPITNADICPPEKFGPIRIGAFGAVRPQKNFMTAAAAAVAIQKQLRFPVELHMSTGGEGDGGSVSRAINEMVAGIPKFKLIRHDWVPWEQFIVTISRMNLLLQPSYTESFNMITADGISVGVPSVVSSAITWAPDSWKADSDDALDIARVGLKLLVDRHAVREGVEAIHRQNSMGLKHWLKFIGA